MFTLETKISLRDAQICALKEEIAGLWLYIKKIKAEALKPSHNKASHEIALRSDIGLQLETLKTGSNIQPVLDYIMDRIAQLQA
jgi:hypothetical protein